MKVLWISNIVFPEAQALLTGNGVLTSSGGWMLGAANALVEYNDIELIVAAPSQDVHKLAELQGKEIRYFLFPLGKGNLKKNDDYRKFWRQIHDVVYPDVVHIHGTEFSHGLAYVDECGAENVVVSIQGLTSEIAKYYSLGLSKWNILKNTTIGDIFRGSAFKDVKRYRIRGEVEIEMLRKVHHVIGRTTFDRSHVWAINPKVQYHFCNEILRDEFYKGQWEYTTCTPHSIFFSQANNPLKGLHFIIKALSIVKIYYPNIYMHVAGRDITKHDSTLRSIYAYSGYGKFIKNLISKFNLGNNISFTGPLTASEMKNELLNANVFVCASSIENSSNSLAEAQMLGVPCVASYVGGIPDLIPNEKCGVLYRCNDIEMLAYQICKVFKESASFDNSHMIQVANARHSVSNVILSLIKIYELISNKNEVVD